MKLWYIEKLGKIHLPNCPKIGKNAFINWNWVNSRYHARSPLKHPQGGGLLLLLLLLSHFSCVRLCATHRWQPTRLPRPWDSPGKNTGVGYRFLLQCMKVKSESEVAQSCPTLSDPMDCSPPGSSVHEICQATVLEWGAIAFSGVKGWKCINVLLCYYQLLGKQRDKQRQSRILCWTDLYVFFHFFLLELMICSCSIVGFCTKTADLLSCCLYIISLCEVKVKWMWKSLSCVRLFATLWTVALQAPLSFGFSRQEYWSG